MPPDVGSNIRAFVNWHEQTVFAGEDVKCTVTFKNVAAEPNNAKQSRSSYKAAGSHHHSQGERQRLASRVKANASLNANAQSNVTKGHRRSALSLSVTPSSRSQSGSVQWPSSATSNDRFGHAHKRSVSIVSIGSSSTVDDHTLRGDTNGRSQRPSHGHNRAASLQIVPQQQPQSGSIAGPRSASLSQRPMGSSPLYNASYPPDRFGRMSGSATAPNTPSVGGIRRSPRGSPNTMPKFRFPPAPPGEYLPQSDSPSSIANDLLSPKTESPKAVSRTDEYGLGISERPASAARILSSTSVAGGTPRSSGEFYSMSNHSSETLASEYVTQPKTSSRPHLRRNSSMIQHRSKTPESIMMGYAQIQGSFTLDGSLVSLGPFEQVKKKGAVGGQGGGVIGLEPSKRDSGLLRGFGWGSISNSIGDLLGSGELSTIKEMRGVANSKSVPILSTPQSILFVDLQLAPGESRAFEYTFKLPKGIPPTHRGKAIKISYSLVIGTQRAGGAKEHQVRSVEIPFKVLSSVNSQGQIMAHDLMNPYLLLRDEAQVRGTGKMQPGRFVSLPSEPTATVNEFLAYVDDLATRPRDEGSGTLLSPTATNSQRPSLVEEATSTKEAIHLAIMRSNLMGQGQQSLNRFEIARNGQRVGVVMLTRPAYRLGETVTMVVDFSNADISCFAIHAALETCEKVDPEVAVRSESSIQRVTRKVYASTSEATLYSRRVVFTPTIPISATPEFVTSAVSLEWKIRVEFVVPSQGTGASSDAAPAPHPLLEQISQDDKGGLVLVAVENLACESFEIPVPLRVFGAVGSGLERLERDEASEEGLAV